MEATLISQDLLSDACQQGYKIMHWSDDHKLTVSARGKMFVMDTSMLTDDPKVTQKRMFPCQRVDPDLGSFRGEEKDVLICEEEEGFHGDYKFRPIHTNHQTRMQHVPYTLYDVTDTSFESSRFRDAQTCRCSSTGREFMWAIDVDTSRCYLWQKRVATGKMVAMANVSARVRKLWEGEGKWTEKLLPNLVVTCMRWLDFSVFGEFRKEKKSGVFCVGTQSGHVIMYTVTDVGDLKLYSAIKCKHKRVASVCLFDSRLRENPSEHVHMAVTFSNGVVSVFTIEAETGCVDENASFEAWDDQDHLKVVDLTWTRLDGKDGSLMVFGKGGSVVAQRVNGSALECHIENKLAVMHVTQLKLLHLRSSGDHVSFKVLTSSDDGRILANEFRLKEKIELASSRELLPSLPGYPVDWHLNGFQVSPNGVFMATVMSQRPTGNHNNSIGHDPKSYLSVYSLDGREDLVDKLVASESAMCDCRDLLCRMKLQGPRYHGRVKEYYEEKNFDDMKLDELQKAANVIQAVVGSKDEDGLLLKLLNKARRRLITMRAFSLLDSLNDNIDPDKDDLKYLNSLRTVFSLQSREFTRSEKKLHSSLSKMKLQVQPRCEYTGSTFSSMVEGNLFKFENSSLWPSVCCLTLHPVYSPPCRSCKPCMTFATIFDEGQLPGKVEVNYKCPVCSGFMT